MSNPTRTVAPNWAPSVRTPKGWAHALTGELLVAYADTSYTNPVPASTINLMKLERNRKKYKTGDNIRFLTKFTEVVHVDSTGGNPYIGFSINGVPKTAEFYSAIGSEPLPTVDQAELIFQYQVQPGDVATAGQVTLGAAAQKATLTSGSGTTGILLTAVTAGTAGNSITLTLVDPAGNNQALSVGVVGSAITVNLATNGSGVITSTALLVKNAIVASGPAAALVLATLVSTGAGVVAAHASQNLSGGTALSGSTGITLNGGTIKDSNGTNSTLTFGGAIVDVSAVTVN